MNTGNQNPAGPRISARLAAIASFVTEGNRLADIGTDHAFLPVYLLTGGKIPYAYCCDVAAGPLQRAAEHIRRYGLEDRAETRLSDGLQAIRPGEADTVLIAGMGGLLMERILRDGADQKDGNGASLRDTVKEWIFSPHTELREFRAWLRMHGFRITLERILLDEGKYYTVMRAVTGDASGLYQALLKDGISAELADRFGPLLLSGRDPLLKTYMEREYAKETAILRRLEKAGSGAAQMRKQELTEETDGIRRILALYAAEVDSNE